MYFFIHAFNALTDYTKKTNLSYLHEESLLSQSNQVNDRKVDTPYSYIYISVKNSRSKDK